jgi:hypothetical protein
MRNAIAALNTCAPTSLTLAERFQQAHEAFGAS